MTKNEMVELGIGTEEERVILQKFRELGRWGSLTIIKQNGAVERIEKTEQTKIGIAK